MDLDPILKSSLKLLHSTSIESGEKIRVALDELLKQKFGSNKTILNFLNKKYLAEEKNPPGTIKETKLIVESIDVDADDDDIKDTTAILNVLKSADTLTNTAEEENLTEFGDLVCVVCSGIGITAGNRLVECCDCHSLYHQECHKLKISDDEANEDTWSCSTCKLKSESASEITTIPSKSPSPSSASSDCKNLEVSNSSSATSRKTSSHSVTKTETTHVEKHSTSEKKSSSTKKRSKHHDSKRRK